MDNYQSNDEYKEEYKERDDNDGKKIAIIIVLLLLLLLGLFFLIRFLFFNTTKEDLLLDAGKEYFEEEKEDLPVLAGTCVTISLDELKEKNYLEKVNKFKKCDGEKTIVKVCKLESGKLQYAPLLTCTNYNSDELYNDFKYGEENELVENESDINFLFIPKEINKGSLDDIKEVEVIKTENEYRKYVVLSETKVYRYRDMEWLWTGTIKKYYPNGETNSSKVTATSNTQPSSEYTEKEATTVKYYSTKSYPSTCAEKTEFKITSIATLTAPKTIYSCYSPNGTSILKKWKPCSEAGLTSTGEPNTYTCGTLTTSPLVSSTAKCGTCSSGLILSSDGKSCGTYVCPGTWSNWTKTACTGNSTVCKSKTETEYKWYKTVDGSTTDYSATAPYPGLIKSGEGKWGEWSKYSTTKYTKSETRDIEENTLLKIKPVDENNSKYWNLLSETPVTMEEMIKIFKDKGYDVETLEDIYNNNMISYGIVLQYRNKKE